MKCEVCGNERFIDAHHYDCREGKISPETINLCRRCHRTYHDRGIEWFDDKFLDKAIEIENKRREILNCQPQKVNPFPLLTRADIKRSDYWNKIHGVKKRRQPLRETKDERQLGLAMIDNLLIGNEVESDIEF